MQQMKPVKYFVTSSSGGKISVWSKIKFWLTRKARHKDLYDEEVRCNSFCPECQWIEWCMETDNKVFVAKYQISK